MQIRVRIDRLSGNRGHEGDSPNRSDEAEWVGSMAMSINFSETGPQHFGGARIPETLYPWIRAARMTTHAAAQEGQKI
jgi:hypothetical protein